MTSPVAPQFQPVHIGDEAKPPLAVVPDPQTLFTNRAARFRALAPNHPLEAYLLMLADLSAAQNDILAKLPPVVMPDADKIERALTHGMAPIARKDVACLLYTSRCV